MFAIVVINANLNEVNMFQFGFNHEEQVRTNMTKKKSIFDRGMSSMQLIYNKLKHFRSINRWDNEIPERISQKKSHMWSTDIFLDGNQNQIMKLNETQLNNETKQNEIKSVLIDQLQAVRAENVHNDNETQK